MLILGLDYAGKTVSSPQAARCVRRACVVNENETIVTLYMRSIRPAVVAEFVPNTCDARLYLLDPRT